MIDFNFEGVEFNFDIVKHSDWIANTILSEDKTEGEIVYVFCNDEYLLDLNKRFLDHDTLTDIITFDNSIGNLLSADIFISSERVKENAEEFGVSFDEELRRVLVHGVLHLCGYKDKTEADQDIMTAKENQKMLLFHVEQ